MLYGVSDLHVDYEENNIWVQELQVHRGDTLLVAGDLTHDLAKLEQTLSVLVHKFEHVAYVPGNHELWIHPKDCTRNVTDSLQKFNEVLAVCKRLGVHTDAFKVCTVNVVPLFSWYDVPPSPHALYLRVEGLSDSEDLWTDTHVCKWPSSLPKDQRSAFFAHLNQDRISCQYDGPVVSLSHFFSCMKQIEFHRATCDARHKARQAAGTASPVRPGSMFPNFSIVAGSSLLGEQIAILKPSIHLFGHSHRELEVTIDGTRYVNSPLAYPFERQKKIVSFSGIVPLVV